MQAHERVTGFRQRRVTTPSNGVNPAHGFLWPAADQLQLLDAALLAGPAARAAFRQWRTTVKLEEEFSWTVLRLLPLVHNSLVRAGEHDILMGRLKGLSRRAWYETQQLFHRVKPVVVSLHAMHMPVMLLKGAPLVISYYGHHALRPMSDVDICVRPADVPRAIACLRDSGWTPTEDPSPDYFRFRHALQFRHANGGELDLHWHALYEALGAPATDWSWDDAEPLQFNEVPVLQPSPTRLLLMLIVHGVRWNHETPVRWIPDAMMVLRQRATDINWDQLLADARMLKVTWRLALGLNWLVQRYAAPVPAWALGALAADRPTLTERMEGHVYLRDFRRYEHSVLGNQYTILADYCRVIDPTRTTAFATRLPDYLRYRWALHGRRDIVPAVFRALARRMRGKLSAMQPVR